LVSELYLISGSISIIATTFAIEEAINFVIRRAAKAAGVRNAFVRDASVGLRVVAVLVAVSAVLGFTKLSSEFTSLTVSGIAALAVSLALQSTLSNMIAGLLLLYDRTIRIGDIIEYSGVKGRVARIALRNTWIEMDSGKIAMVSNSNLSSGPLINHSAADRLSKKFALR
jgi:small conductance mechanosensitive channel